MSDNLKELSEKLENINNNVNTLLSTLNSSKNINFGNYVIKSTQVDLNDHKAIINVEGVSLFEAENAVNEEGSLNIDKFSMENSFITGYKWTHTETKFTLALNNLSYKSNDKKLLNIAIMDKPQELKRIDSYISDNANNSFIQFELYGTTFTIMIKNENLFLFADCNIEQDQFYKYVRGIKLALGFLMCDFIGGPNVFILTDENITNIENFKIFYFGDEKI